MRTFQAKVFDDIVDTGITLYSDPTFNDVLGQAEEISIFAVIYGIQGGGETLTVQLEESPNQIHWRNKQGTAEINAVGFSSNVVLTFAGRDTGALPSSGFLRLRVELAGTVPRGHVKLWVTLRTEHRS